MEDIFGSIGFQCTRPILGATMCIRNFQKCNGFDNCGDKSDERNCGKIEKLSLTHSLCHKMLLEYNFLNTAMFITIE